MYSLLAIENNHITEGSKGCLMDRVINGDDITLSITLDSFNENLFMHNILTFYSNCIGFTYPHLAHGSLEPLIRIYNEPLSSSIYMYDTESRNVVVHNMVSSNINSTVVHSNNASYNKYLWRGGRRYCILKEFDVELIKNLGSDFKVRLDFGIDIKMVIKPDIVYFTNTDTEFVIKSSQILLPTDFVEDVGGYIKEQNNFTDTNKFGISYITILSNGKMIIYHIMNCLADNTIDEHVRKNTFDYSRGSKEMLKEYDVNIEILVPE